MTVIAYRDGIMACDSCWAEDDKLIASKTKIYKLSSGALFGHAGSADCRALIRLLDKVDSPRLLPTTATLRELRSDFASLLVLPSGKVFCIYNTVSDKESDNDTGIISSCTVNGCTTVGSGGDFAMAAMLAHKSVTAAQAVKVACRLSLSCRLPVHILKL